MVIRDNRTEEKKYATQGLGHCRGEFESPAKHPCRMNSPVVLTVGHEVHKALGRPAWCFLFLLRGYSTSMLPNASNHRNIAAIRRVFSVTELLRNFATDPSLAPRNIPLPTVSRQESAQRG